MPALFHYWVDFVIQTLSAAQRDAYRLQTTGFFCVLQG